MVDFAEALADSTAVEVFMVAEVSMAAGNFMAVAVAMEVAAGIGKSTPGSAVADRFL